MSQDLDRILEKYYIAREDLLNQSADSWAEVRQLCEKVPENIDLNTIWMFARDKPCWSNIKVAGGTGQFSTGVNSHLTEVVCIQFGYVLQRQHVPQSLERDSADCGRCFQRRTP